MVPLRRRRGALRDRTILKFAMDTSPHALQLSRRRRPMTRRGSRAVGYIWFAIVAVPALLFSAGMSVDLGRIVVANREAANMAQAAATAGALQYQAGVAVLDSAAAQSAAHQLWAQGVAAGSLGLVSDASIQVSVTPVYDPNTVTVTVHYDVGGLVFLGWFRNGSKTASLTTSATAHICVPGATSFSSGYCARPGVG